MQDGCTSLHLAAGGGHSHCVQFLIQKGVDVHMKNEVYTLHTDYEFYIHLHAYYWYI